MKKVYEDIKKFFESKISERILIAIGIVIVVVLIFSAGIAVGFHKASFGRDWGENYEHNFGIRENRHGFPFGLDQDNFPNSNGAIGKIINIQLPTIIVQGKDNIEKVVLIKDDTRIQEMMTIIKPTDLKINDNIVTIGIPNSQGQIEAKFIRVMPQ
jgi:predicted hydrocarbon binding protein